MVGWSRQESPESITRGPRRGVRVAALAVSRRSVFSCGDRASLNDHGVLLQEILHQLMAGCGDPKNSQDQVPGMWGD